MTYIPEGILSESLSIEDYKRYLNNSLKEANSEVVIVKQATVLAINAKPSGYWNNTGIYKPKGITIVVSYVGGVWDINPYWGPCDAGGDSRYRGGETYLLNGGIQGALVGKVGGDNSGGGSSVFPIGNLGFVPPELEGLIWLSPNDDRGGFGDNSGKIDVAISVR